MTPTRLDRMICPTCGRQVAFRLVRAPRVNRGRYGAIPGIRKPVRHRKPATTGVAALTVGEQLSAQWCPAGERLGGR